MNEIAENRNLALKIKISYTYALKALIYYNQPSTRQNTSVLPVYRYRPKASFHVFSITQIRQSGFRRRVNHDTHDASPRGLAPIFPNHGLYAPYLQRSLYDLRVPRPVQ